jgi:two-component system, response regulator PdtaR
MSHALIIDDNMIVSRAIEDRLTELGFESFDHTWTEQQATAAAASRSPDLVVIGDSIESSSALAAARNIAMQRNTPVLMVTADPAHARRRFDQQVSFDGPFLLNEIESAVALARASPSQTW